MKKLLQHYKEKRPEIQSRLGDFNSVYHQDDKAVFAELCFCILTPQADAVKCDKAINQLKASGLLYTGSAQDIRPSLKAARFVNKKARFLVKARRFFKKRDCFCIKQYINKEDIIKTRERLVKNICGFGYKEASHFLRNIGLGRDLAILDVHILKNLLDYGVIKRLPKSLTRKNYLDIEEKMRRFSKRINIPMDELDLLFWSKETGLVFK